jgi:membrane protein implicated in regulation of membrane protease activity
MDLLNGFYAAHPFWSWVCLAALLLAAEAATGSGYLLWPAASAMLTGLIAGLRFGLPAELLVFAVLTIASTVLSRRYLPRPLMPHGPDINDPRGRIVGHRGQAACAFEHGRGRVLVDGKEWAAELEGVGELPMGAEVQVTRVLSGARLKVRAS